jgi:hypothetical protein
MSMLTSEDELTDKKSVTLRRRLIAEVTDMVGPRGFSAATDEALSSWLARARLRRAVADYETENGEITQAEMDEAVAGIGGL